MNYKLKYKRILLSAAAAFAFVSFNGCSTKKNTLVTRTYHNITSHYNGYFNARESFKKGKRKVEDGHKYNYEKLLPVFIYGDESAARGVYPEMDKAIEKCSNVIQRHSIYIKGKEYCNWIDDSYLLIGKSYFYKKNYERAIENFEYIAKEYKEDPVRFYAMLWLARTYMEMNDYSKANSLINLAAGDKEFPEKLEGSLAAVKADYYIRKESYARAIPQLKKAIENQGKRKVRASWTFLLAQIYEKTGNNSNAMYHYAEVVDLNPPYEMAFYAKIHRAMAYKGAGSSAEIKKQLNKMLKDDKNKEYRDQIYYALAEIALNEQKEEKGIEYLKLSASSSISNDKQKGLAFLKLGQLYFDKEAYRPAQTYYDSTVTFLNQDYPDMDEIVSKRNSLTRLVKDMSTIEVQDSLQQIAGLSVEERNSLIEDLIEKAREEEERKREEEMSGQMMTQQNFNELSNQLPGMSGGEWYFYNPSAVSFGFSEFKKKWGNRKLEDDWRRSKKSKSFAGNNSFDLEPLENDSLATPSLLLNKSYYLENLPLQEQQMASSNDMIIEALYDMGMVYKEDLNNQPQAINAFEDLVSRYDSSKYHINCYYQLYRLYNISGNSAKTAHYKNLILGEYPDSDYARLVKDPNSINEVRKEKQKIEALYEKTYSFFRRGYYEKTILNCNLADSLHPDNKLKPQFGYLKAMSIGKTDSIPYFKAALEALVKEYPDAPVAKKAEKTLALLADQPAIASAEEKKDQLYRVHKLSKHSCVFVVPTADADANKMKIALSDYNSEYFRMQNLKISSVFLDKSHQMISIKEFSNKDQAMDYFNSLKESGTISKLVKDEKKASFFAISYDNFATFYQDKDVNKYMAFFNQHYKN